MVNVMFLTALMPFRTLFEQYVLLGDKGITYPRLECIPERTRIAQAVQHNPSHRFHSFGYFVFSRLFASIKLTRALGRMHYLEGICVIFNA